MDAKLYQVERVRGRPLYGQNVVKVIRRWVAFRAADKLFMFS